MSDIFSLFDLVDEDAKKKEQEEEQKKREQAEKMAKAQEELKAKVEASRKNNGEGSNKIDKKPEVKKDVFSVNEETVIRHFGESIEITQYFSPEELAEGLLVKKKDSDPERTPLEPEMLRMRMEKDYPELVKEFTEVIYYEPKNIVFITMKAKKKGYQEIDQEVLSNDGSFFSRYKLPKVPINILKGFIEVSKFFSEHSLECHGDLYFNLQKNEYYIDYPKQTVSTYTVEVTEDSLFIHLRNEASIKVLEIHSHHKMKAFPSSLDDQSERIPGMLYTIIGEAHQYFPRIYTRLFVDEHIGHIKIDENQVFESPFSANIEIDLTIFEVK